MGLGALMRSTPPAAAPAHTRAITEFAIIDGVAVDGSGEIGARYRGGMSIPGAWRASILISDMLGSVPWDAYRQLGARPIEKITPTPPLLEQPSPPDTRMTTISSLALDLLWNGNAVEIIAARSPSGWPTATLPVPAELCGVRRVTETAYSPLPVGTVEYSIGGLTFAPWEVIHTKGPCAPGALKGMGVLENHMTGGALGLAREQMRQAANLANHGVPTGYLKSENPDTTDDELREAKAKWMQNQRDRTIAALNSTTTFTPLSWNPEQLQLVEARRYTLTDLELIFGLPVGWLGGMNSARQYSNIEQDAVNLLKFTLGGHLARFEQTRSIAFPRGTTVKANLEAFLRADTLTRYQAYAIALDKRFKTVNEIRVEENDPPVPWGDEPAGPTAAPSPEAPRSAIGMLMQALMDPSQLGATQARSQSNLDNTPEGRRLWDYWTKGEGLAKWAESPHPYTALVVALREAGVPAHSIHGLAANIFHAVTGIWPGEREGDNPAGPG